MNGQHIGEYQEYEGLIEMRARAYAPEEDLEELMQEGYFAYIQAIESYDPEKKACFRSWLYRKVSAHFQHIQEMRHINSKRHVYGKELGADINHEDRAMFLMSLKEISNEAQYIAELVIDTPKDLVIKLTKENICKYLRKKGWKWITIEPAMAELKSFMKKKAEAAL